MESFSTRCQGLHVQIISTRSTEEYYVSEPFNDPKDISSTFTYQPGFNGEFRQMHAREGQDFKHLREKFLRLLDAKIKADIFVGLQILYIYN